jgi:hypothetical protein
MSAHLSSLQYAHANLWLDDRAYRWSWYIWPQCVAALVAGLMFFTSLSSPTDINPGWAKPSTVLEVSKILEALRDEAYESRSAFERLKKLSAEGGMLSPFYFATLYDPNITRRSSIVAADAARALELYRLAAERGVNAAQYNLIFLQISDKYGVQDIAAACLSARKLGKPEELTGTAQNLILGLKNVEKICNERIPINAPTPPRPTVGALPATGGLIMPLDSYRGWSVVSPSSRLGNLRRRSEEFITGLYSTTSGPADAASAALNNYYADTVLYYGKEMSREQVITQVQRFVARWPDRDYRPREESVKIDCDEGTLTCTITGVVQFDAQSSVRNERSTGEATFEYHLRFPASGQEMPKITAEGGAVLNRSVQALSSETNDSPSNFFDRLIMRSLSTPPR